MSYPPEMTERELAAYAVEYLQTAQIIGSDVAIFMQVINWLSDKAEGVDGNHFLADPDEESEPLRPIGMGAL